MTLNIPERYLYALNALLVAILAYFAALLVGDMVRLRLAANAVPPLAESAPAAAAGGIAASGTRAVYSLIEQRDIFNLAPAPEAPPVENENLNVTLLGTSHLTSGLRPYAIIQDQSGEQSLYRLGETIPSVGKLLQVGKNRVLIEHNGHRVALEIPRDENGAVAEDNDNNDNAPRPTRRSRRPFINNPMLRRRPPLSMGGVRTVAPNAYAIDRSAVNRNMQNMAQLFTQIRAVPNLQNGASNGFRLSEIQPGSIFQSIGLRDGDVVTAVSGQSVGDPAKAMQLLSTLQTRSNITLKVIRGGTPVQLSYTIH